MALQLASSAFASGGDFPPDYTCNGRNVSPPLRISGVPTNASCLVLILDDPDAAKEPAGSGHIFDHWIVYNIPAVDQEIAEGSIPANSELGKNSRGESSYTGPCPPTFRHKYIFRLLALNSKLNFSSPPTKAEILDTVQDRVIEEARLVTYYERPKS